MDVQHINPFIKAIANSPGMIFGSEVSFGKPKATTWNYVRSDVSAIMGFWDDAIGGVVQRFSYENAEKTASEFGASISSATIPIIVVTTEAGKTRVIGAMEAGVNSYAVTPFTPASLPEKIDQAMANSASLASSGRRSNRRRRRWIARYRESVRCGLPGD